MTFLLSRLIAASLICVSTTACVTSDAARVGKAAGAEAAADASVAALAVADEALKLMLELPQQPADCRRTTKSGVVVGDRLDVALEKSDAALYAQNQRGLRCVEFNDKVRAGFQKKARELREKL